MIILSSMSCISLPRSKSTLSQPFKMITFGCLIVSHHYHTVPSSLAVQWAWFGVAPLIFFVLFYRGWKCSKCDLTENLWLNLTDGSILCGRKYFDGKVTLYLDKAHALQVLGQVSQSQIWLTQDWCFLRHDTEFNPCGWHVKDLCRACVSV